MSALTNCIECKAIEGQVVLLCSNPVDSLSKGQMPPSHLFPAKWQHRVQEDCPENKAC